MQNRQAGTRGLSAGDWTRLKRIQHAVRTVKASYAVPEEYNVTIPAYAPVSNIIPPTSSSPAGTAFVLACIDPRFASALESYLKKELADPGFYSYDLFILAGASLGGTLTGNGTPNGPPNTNNKCTVVSANTNWRETLLDHIQAAITLHDVKTFYVIDHLDCGAFKNCDNAGDDLNPALHETQFTALKTFIDGRSFVPHGGGAPVNGSAVFPTWNGLYFDIAVESHTILKDYPTNTQQDRAYFPPDSGAKVLVLGCIDPRFNAALTEFLIGYKDVQFIYDLFILAGASLGANQSYTGGFSKRTQGDTGDYPNNALADGSAGIGQLGANWGPTFFDHLSIARFLHKITEVWVFDHLDCGAYKLIKLNDGTLDPLPPDNDIPPHTEEILKLQGFINTYTSIADPLGNPPKTLAFKGFVMDMSGNITKVVDSQTGVPIPGETFGSSRIRNPASEYTDIVARRVADYVTQSQSSAGTPTLTLTTICSCTSAPLRTKLANCASCKNGMLH